MSCSTVAQNIFPPIIFPETRTGMNLHSGDTGVIPIHPFLPHLSVCQPWKLEWLGSKLTSTEMNALEQIQRMESLQPIHIDKHPLMSVFGDTQRILQTFPNYATPQGLPPTLEKSLGAVIGKLDKYILRLEADPHIAELPFDTKSRFLDPLSDIRVVATNLRHAIKPCIKDHAATVRADHTYMNPSLSATSVIGRGFL